MTEKNWTPLEHQVLLNLKPLKLQGKKCLLMISGGADSMALLSILQNLQPVLQTEIEILHCHHGPTESPLLQKYRDEAASFATEVSRSSGLPFHLAKSPLALESEEELRNFRKAAAEKIKQSGHFDFVVWGHHQDDLLETQMLFLIRGAGPEAVFEPLVILRDFDLRPLLSISREQIINYLQHQKQQWLEDPSNRDEKYLRNWLRHTWLPQLEAKCPGALKSFSRSLDLIRESMEETNFEAFWFKEGVSRPLFLTLNVAQKKQLLAIYLRRCGQKEFTHNQIKEILKHLDNPQLNHTFNSAQLVWHLSKDLIYARPRAVVNAF